MQGRLSEVVDGKIQAFPWNGWKGEFDVAKKIGIPLMEWTLDHLNLYKNPLMTAFGQEEIIQLSEANNLKIPSLTADCCMQAPFWKATSENKKALEADFGAIIKACGVLNIRILVIPLVDNGALTTKEEEKSLKDVLVITKLCWSRICKIAFESDFSPSALGHFIGEMDPKLFGINYDIGNSASLGFNINEEFSCYGDRILNVHVKDRLLGGATVPLGEGNSDFKAVFSKLSEYDYQGNYILQTARDPLGLHSQAIEKYFDMTIDWISHYGP